MLPRISTRASLEAMAGKPTFAVTTARTVTGPTCCEEPDSRYDRVDLHAARGVRRQSSRGGTATSFAGNARVGTMLPMPRWLACVCVPVSFVAAQATLVVPGTHATIQAAIAVAQPNDTVLVMPGTHLERIDFLGKAITVRSAAGAAATTIDGNQLGSVVTFTTNETPSSVLPAPVARLTEARCEVAAHAHPAQSRSSSSSRIRGHARARASS
jgi:hypothetical protein